MVLNFRNENASRRDDLLRAFSLTETKHGYLADRKEVFRLVDIVAA
jgi:hypothetical protein